MSALNTSNYALPRTLKQSFLTFVRIFGVVYILLLLLSALIGIGGGSFETLGVVGVMGGVLLLVYGVVALGIWQTMTLFDDHLVFSTLKEKSTVFYKDVSEVNAVMTGGGPKTMPVMVLYLHHRGASTNPLKIGIQSFNARDRTLLLQLIKQGAPGAHFNPLAEKVCQG